MRLASASWDGLFTRKQLWQTNSPGRRGWILPPSPLRSSTSAGSSSSSSSSSSAAAIRSFRIVSRSASTSSGSTQVLVVFVLVAFGGGLVAHRGGDGLLVLFLLVVGLDDFELVGVVDEVLVDVGLEIVFVDVTFELVLVEVGLGFVELLFGEVVDFIRHVFAAPGWALGAGSIEGRLADTTSGGGVSARCYGPGATVVVVVPPAPPPDAEPRAKLMLKTFVTSQFPSIRASWSWA